MAPRNEEAEAVQEELRRFGIKGTVEPLGKHVAVRWSYPGGQTRSVTVAASASDHRAVLNARGYARRTLRADAALLPSQNIVRFERAMELPSQPAAVPVITARLESDFLGLLDLVSELQDTNAELRDQIAALHAKLGGLRVTTTLAFGDQSEQSTAAPSPPPQQRHRAVPAGSPWDKVRNYLADGSWRSVSDIAAATELTNLQVSGALNYQCHKKNPPAVENGQRGNWRLKPA